VQQPARAWWFLWYACIIMREDATGIELPHESVAPRVKECGDVAEHEIHAMKRRIPR
jgi:hypothetical protein